MLAKDRSLAERQLDLSVVEKQLAEARDSWRRARHGQPRARADPRRLRSPPPARDARRGVAVHGQAHRRPVPPHLDAAGATTSCWSTTADGQSLPVDVLSRGTREQLFLSVRLALVAMFARRGVNLPMVLDDVLVNFDVGRARRAAEVLCEFAAAGHQTLFFTCHEHMWQMFKELDADCRRLPVRRGQPEPAPAGRAVASRSSSEPLEPSAGEEEAAARSAAPKPHCRRGAGDELLRLSVRRTGDRRASRAGGAVRSRASLRSSTSTRSTCRSSRSRRRARAGRAALAYIVGDER